MAYAHQRGKIVYSLSVAFPSVPIRPLTQQEDVGIAGSLDSFEDWVCQALSSNLVRATLTPRGQVLFLLKNAAGLAPYSMSYSALQAASRVLHSQ